MTKLVYSFGDGRAEGSAEMKALLGGKGANLAEMCNLGLPVPPGFTITTEVCADFAADGRYPGALNAAVEDALSRIEETVGAGLADPANPLLLSVRSGARASMPGMMDTVLNLGLNEATAEGLAARANDARFAFDSYRRFVQMFGQVVLGVGHEHFENIIGGHKDARGLEDDRELEAEDWRAIVAAFKERVRADTGAPFPEDARDQLWAAIGAVFGSWSNPRAVTYRRLHGIPDSRGTAVTVQAMVFGNMGADSATGVAFTRDPSTGAAECYGEYMLDAQGEDVVAGIRTPQPLTASAREANGAAGPAMEEAMPKAFAALRTITKDLEAHYRDMQDIEFTVQKGKLWMLQTRTAKRTVEAALKVAVDQVGEGLISESEALARVEPGALDRLLHPTLDPTAHRDVLACGLPASPGAASGLATFDAARAETRAAAGEAVILVRAETSPEDIHGMHAAGGILTARGGMTSHAAVVARGMGRPCVAGAGALNIDAAARAFTVGERRIGEGEVITIDGASGEVMAGAVPTVEPELSGAFVTFMEWADRTRRLAVRANAETPADARTARAFGAEGIGLCRTEHMFFDAERIATVREMILAADEDGRRAALARILPMQRADFAALFEIMAGLPVTIRLLDPPLHEFLPRTEDEIAALAKSGGVDARRVRDRLSELAEANPMLGHRGCRLGISYPEIYEMQARAIFEAAAEVSEARGEAVAPEIMVPLVAEKAELDRLKQRIDAVAARVAEETGAALEYQVGTMIELPRACLVADDIAEQAEFFSFGTNDLTQTTFGISRDDSAKFLGAYIDQGILGADPFVSIDAKGVGALMETAVRLGRGTRPDLKLGICGEHDGDPASIRFCHDLGLDYVSCSPYRIPIARLAAAQAALAGEAPEKD